MAFLATVNCVPAVKKMHSFTRYFTRSQPGDGSGFISKLMYVNN